jgi:hypothetical protein
MNAIFNAGLKHRVPASLVADKIEEIWRAKPGTFATLPVQTLSHFFSIALLSQTRTG